MAESTHSAVKVSNPDDLKDLSARDLLEQLTIQMILNNQLLLIVANELSDQNLSLDDLEY